MHNQFWLIGIEDKERVQQLLVEHNEVINEFHAKLKTFRAQNLDAVDTRAADKIVEFSHKYDKSFDAMAAKYHEIEDFKEQFDHLVNRSIINLASYYTNTKKTWWT